METESDNQLPSMRQRFKRQRLAQGERHHKEETLLHEQEMPPVLDHDRDADILEAQSVKYNVARIVRLSSGAFALFSHYREGAIDLIKVGTIEEIAGHIPSADACAFTAPELPRGNKWPPLLTKVDLADLGL